MSNFIRNVALVGHHGTGKTSLAEAMLFSAGAIKKKGTISGKNTVADFEEEEKDRGGTIDASVLHYDHKNTRINLIDCPGPADFIAGVVEGLTATETALVTVNAAAGIEVMTRKLWGMTEKRGMARMLVITKMDHDLAKYDEVLSQLQEVFGSSVAPLLIPIGTGKEFKGVFNLLTDPHNAPEEIASKATELSSNLIETVVSADDALMERYLNDEKIPLEELTACFEKALVKGIITPVLCVSGEKDIGVKELLDLVVSLTPSPMEIPRSISRKTNEGTETRELNPGTNAPFYAQVFKSYRDPFLGKVSYLRVFSGSLHHSEPATSSSAIKADKFAHFLEAQGKATKEIESASAGSIFLVAKYDTLNTGDTLTTENDGFTLPAIPFPEPMFSLAVAGNSRSDEAKMGEHLRHLVENDPTFSMEVDHQTKELVVHAIGQLHMDLMFHRLKQHHVEVTTKPPKIPYRSTITTTAEVRYRHKKQSGGSGQFGEVQIKIEPNPEGGYEFIDEIKGGVIPHTLIPSVDKGVAKVLKQGAWPGIPVVNIKVRLNDGKTHPVDSKDIAFQMAGKHAFQEAFEQAHPTLIEPIVHLEVVVPSQYMGDITGHLSGKRGKIQGMDQLGSLLAIQALVPSSEIQRYAGELKSLTGGEGFYHMEFSHYEQVPANLAQPVIKAATEHRSVVEV